jgi:hypothetical protein
MSFQNPVGGVPDPFSYRAEGTQGNRSGSGGPPEEPPEDHKGLIGLLIEKIRSKINTLLEWYGSTSFGKGSFKENLIRLKASLDLLKNEDRSQDIHFLSDLSQSWNQAVAESLEYNEEAALIFKLFVKKIAHYPENQGHTFGYYLTEYAGQKWIPFPYMDLVQKIHMEYEKNPDTSALTEWTRLLSDAIRLLHKK